MKHIKCLFFMLFFFLHSTFVFSQESKSKKFGSNDQFLQESWDQYIWGFREGHNFSLYIGYITGKWAFYKFSSPDNLLTRSTGISMKFSYAYHLQWIKKFGYFLGTSFGYKDYNFINNKLHLNNSIIIPGLFIGIVYNYNSAFRISTGLDVYLERWNHLGIDKDNSSSVFISGTARNRDFFVSFDIFLKLKWALQIQIHDNYAIFKPPLEAEGYNIDTKVINKTNCYSLGMLYHLI